MGIECPPFRMLQAIFKLSLYSHYVYVCDFICNICFASPTCLSVLLVYYYKQNTQIIMFFFLFSVSNHNHTSRIFRDFFQLIQPFNIHRTIIWSFSFLLFSNIILYTSYTIIYLKNTYKHGTIGLHLWYILSHFNWS